MTFGRTFRNPKVSSMEGRDSLGSEIADELDFIEPTRMIDEPTQGRGRHSSNASRPIQ